MDSTIDTLDAPLRIVGPSAEVDKEHASAIIGELWQRAAATGALRAGEPAYAVYTGYQDRFANRYRVLVGAASELPVTDGHDAVEIAPGRYASFEASGPAGEAAARLWRYAWTRWEGRGERAFDTDFERHQGSADASDVTLFLGLSTT